jgi:transforming growth factor-beta-induced protein
MNKKLFLGGAIAVLSLTPSSFAFAQDCDGCPVAKQKAKAALASNSETKSIVATASAAGQFGTLLAAARAAGLVEALEGRGPLTLFAPTDAAFAKLPAGTVEGLLKPENKAALARILTYHVVAGDVRAEAVVKLTNATTLSGQRVDIRVGTEGAEKGKVFVDAAEVVRTDIACTNGVTHVLDSVILPASQNLAEVASGAGTFKTLVAAARAAGLVEALTGDAPLTVFAPTDAAFAKLPKGTVESLLLPENKERLAAILKYHIVAGRVYSDQAVKLGSATTLQGGNLPIAATEKGATVGGAMITAVDIEASNGVIHVIDSVLLPQ